MIKKNIITPYQLRNKRDTANNLISNSSSSSSSTNNGSTWLEKYYSDASTGVTFNASAMTFNSDVYISGVTVIYSGLTVNSDLSFTGSIKNSILVESGGESKYNVWKYIGSRPGGASNTIHYLLLAPKTQTNIRLQGSVFCHRESGSSTRATDRIDLFYSSNSSAVWSGNFNVYRASDALYPEISVVEVTYNSVVYIAVKFNPNSTSVLYKDFWFDGMATNCSFSIIAVGSSSGEAATSFSSGQVYLNGLSSLSFKASKLYERDSAETYQPTVQAINDEGFTLFEIEAPIDGDNNSKEATLVLMRRTDPVTGGAEFTDVYDMSYSDSKQAGIRVQARGAGELRNWVLDFQDAIGRYNAIKVIPNDSINIYNKLNVSGDTVITGNLHVDGNITASEEIAAWMVGELQSTILDGVTANAPIIKSGSTLSLNYNTNQFELSGNQLKIKDSIASGLQTSGGTISGDLSISGNLTVNGTTFTTNAETVEIADNLLLINKNETGAGVTAGLAGIEVDRGTSTNYRFIFDESTQSFRVGQIGSLQAVATREDSPISNGFSYWDASTYKFKTKLLTKSDITDFGSYLTTSGGTLTGNATISKESPALNFVDSTGSTYNAAWLYNNDVMYYQWGGGTKFSISSNGTINPIGSIQISGTTAIDSSRNAYFNTITGTTATLSSNVYLNDGSGIYSSGSQILRNNGTATVLSGKNGTMYFRPVGDTSTTGQATLDVNGNFATAGAFTSNGVTRIQSNGYGIFTRVTTPEIFGVSVSDFNSIGATTYGSFITPFYSGFQPSNNPSAGANYYAGFEVAPTTNYKTQIATGAIFTTVPGLYLRQEQAGTWGSWATVYHSQNFNTTSIPISASTLTLSSGLTGTSANFTSSIFVTGGTTSYKTSSGVALGSSTSTGAVEIFGTPSTGASIIDFSPADGTTDFSGRINYAFATDRFSLYTAATERVRLDSTGFNLLNGAIQISGTSAIDSSRNAYLNTITGSTLTVSGGITGATELLTSSASGADCFSANLTNTGNTNTVGYFRNYSTNGRSALFIGGGTADIVTFRDYTNTQKAAINGDGSFNSSGSVTALNFYGGNGGANAQMLRLWNQSGYSVFGLEAAVAGTTYSGTSALATFVRSTSAVQTLIGSTKITDVTSTGLAVGSTSASAPYNTLKIGGTNSVALMPVGNGSYGEIGAYTGGAYFRSNAYYNGGDKFSASSYDAWGVYLDHTNGFRIRRAAAGTADGTVTYSTIAQILSTGLTVTGNITATGEVTAYSDRRLKSNIKSLESASEKVMKLNPVTYEKDNKESIGFIAQELKEVYPEFVSGEENEDSYLSVNYQQMVAVLTKTIQEQNELIKKLAERIDRLEGK